MFTLAQPFILFALPLPFLVFFLKKEKNEPNAPTALYVPFFKILKTECEGFSKKFSFFSKLFFGLAWAFFVFSAARPLFVGEPISIQEKQRQLMLVLDVSGSMEEDDFVLGNRRVSRLDMVKALAKDFLEKRKGDAVGLTLFGTEAYTYVPLTTDVETALQMLSEIGIGIAGDKTAIGDALGLALKNMKDIPEESKVIVLLSDGAANAGIVHPEKTIDLAKKMGVKIYTVGIGGSPFVLNTFFGKRKVNPAAGLDEPFLKKTAHETGGKYFRATDSSDMKNIYDEINRLEPTEKESTLIYPTKELFFYPLLVGRFCGWFGVWFRREV